MWTGKESCRNHGLYCYKNNQFINNWEDYRKPTNNAKLLNEEVHVLFYKIKKIE